MDFTPKAYKQLLLHLKESGYVSFTFADYCKGLHAERFAILRHDVDLKPLNSLQIAKIEHSLNMRASYYFRAVPESWDENVIHAIANMGHEIGYHYESLTTCNGNIKAAYQDFFLHLHELRKITTVETICMHGSPRSPYDSKDIWKQGFSYRNLNIIGEPYFDTDFSKIFYLTDTGRRWDGFKVSVRDKIDGWQDQWTRQGLTFHKTDDIINALHEQRLPARIMLTTHPQRWNDPGMEWCKELILQNMKNMVKRILINCKK